jgi:hypothetical protein
MDCGVRVHMVIIAKYMIKKAKEHFDVNSTNQLMNWEETIYYVAKSGNLDRVNFTISLIRKLYICYTCSNCNKNCDKFQYDQGLQGACVSGNLDIVKLMLNMELSTDPNEIDWNYLLFRSAESGNIQLVNFIKDKCNEYQIQIKWSKGLKGASINGNLDIIKYFVNQCDDSHIQPKLSHALYFAYLHNHTELIKYLIELHKERQLEINWTYTLYGAYENGNLDNAKFLISMGADPSNISFHHVCYGGNLQLIKYVYDNHIINHSNTLHGQSKDGIMAAIQTGNITLVKWLLSKYEKYNISEINDIIDAACIYGHMQLVKYLLEIYYVNDNNSIDGFINTSHENGNYILENYLKQLKK